LLPSSGIRKHALGARNDGVIRLNAFALVHMTLLREQQGLA